jgi:tetratricopeptide (TPR) repeat protein
LLVALDSFSPRLPLRRYDAALASFTRVAQLEPEHAQAWNNIAALCLRTERWRPGFKALQEALKYSREQWQSWDNLATVAAQLGEWNTLMQV